MSEIIAYPFEKARALLEAELRAKAQSDTAFRAALLSDPHAALLDLLGTDPVPSLAIRVLEETAGEVVLVLPRRIEADELPDELLDYASGGAYKGCKGDGWTQDKLGRIGIDPF
ncbi:MULTISPECIES: NHLP leader peptide family natural product precursor [unclassified Pannonibacter]|uniref:NHLP leader peptide family natural product precursor n=1 Tax=unclassified Pannonibacter TaxID=2627228 RepID=UPI0016457362|nr:MULTISPECIES: NHLP leader peptide family natural product precursor [unclassified Pannonibacter]